MDGRTLPPLQEFLQVPMPRMTNNWPTFPRHLLHSVTISIPSELLRNIPLPPDQHHISDVAKRR